MSTLQRDYGVWYDMISVEPKFMAIVIVIALILCGILILLPGEEKFKVTYRANLNPYRLMIVNDDEGTRVCERTTSGEHIIRLPAGNYTFSFYYDDDKYKATRHPTISVPTDDYVFCKF